MRPRGTAAFASFLGDLGLDLGMRTTSGPKVPLLCIDLQYPAAKGQVQRRHCRKLSSTDESHDLDLLGEVPRALYRRYPQWV